MTSLSKQLALLREKETTNERAFKDVERPSILFTFKEAASIEPIFIYRQAQSAFSQKVIKMPSLMKFRKLVYQEEYYEVDREKMNQGENEILHQELNQFLISLSNSLTDIKTMKILEFLLRNFEIHKYESEYLILCFLHYHNTSTFVKLIQNVNLNQSNKWYRNLENLIKQGKSLSRLEIQKSCLNHNLTLMDELLNINISYYEHHSYNQNENYAVTNSLVKSTQETIGLKFLIISIIEMQIKQSWNIQLKLSSKKILFSLIDFVSRNKATCFHNGIFLLANYMILNEILSNQEINDLMEDLQNSETSPQKMINLILLASQKSYFFINSQNIEFLNGVSQKILIEISKNYSLTDLLIKVNEFLINDIEYFDNYLSLTNFLIKDLSHDQNFQFDEIVQNNILDSLAELICSLSDKFNNPQSIALCKEIRNIVQDKCSSLLGRIVEIFQENDQNVKQGLQFLKESFGRLEFYGIKIDQSLNIIKINHFWQNTQEEQINIVQQLASQKLNKNDQNLIFQLSQNLFQNLNKMNQKLKILKILIKFSENSKIEFLENFFDEIFDKNYQINQFQIDQLKDIIVTNRLESEKIELFNFFILEDYNEKSEQQIKEMINQSLKLLFDQNLENLLKIFNYAIFNGFNEKIVKRTIDRMAESAFRIKITKKLLPHFNKTLHISLSLLEISQGVKKEEKNIKFQKMFDNAIKSLKKLSNQENNNIIMNIISLILQKNDKNSYQVKIDEQQISYIFQLLRNQKNIQGKEEILCTFTKFLMKQKIDLSAKEIDKFLIFSLKIFHKNFKFSQKIQEFFQILKKFKIKEKFGKKLKKLILQNLSQLTSKKRELFMKKLRLVFKDNFDSDKGKVINLINRGQDMQCEDIILSCIKDINEKFVENYIKKNSHSQSKSFISQSMKFYLKRGENLKFLKYLQKNLSHSQIRQIYLDQKSYLFTSNNFLRVISFWLTKNQLMISDWFQLKFSIKELEQVTFLLVRHEKISQQEINFLNLSIQKIIAEKVKPRITLSLWIMLRQIMISGKLIQLRTLSQLIISFLADHHKATTLSNKNFQEIYQIYFEEHESNVNCQTILKYLKMNLSDQCNDIGMIKNGVLYVDQSKFTNSKIIHSLIDQSIVSIQNNIENQDNFEELTLLIDYLLLFVIKDKDNVLSQIDSITKNIIEIYQKKIEFFKSQISLKFQKSQNLSEIYQNLENQQNGDVLRVKLLEEKIIQYQIKIMMKISQSQFDQQSFKRHQLVISLMEFLDKTIMGGFVTNYNQDQNILRNGSFKNILMKILKEVYSDNIFELLLALSIHNFDKNSIKIKNMVQFSCNFLNEVYYERLRDSFEYPELILSLQLKLQQQIHFLNNHQESLSNFLTEDLKFLKFYLKQKSKNLLFKKMNIFMNQLTLGLAKINLERRNLYSTQYQEHILGSVESIFGLFLIFLISNQRFFSVENSKNTQKIMNTLYVNIYKISIKVYPLSYFLISFPFLLEIIDDQKIYSSILHQFLKFLNKKLYHSNLTLAIQDTLREVIEMLLNSQENNKTYGTDQAQLLTQIYSLFNLLNTKNEKMIDLILQEHSTLIEETIKKLDEIKYIKVKLQFYHFVINCCKGMKPFMLKNYNFIVKKFFNFIFSLMVQNGRISRETVQEIYGDGFFYSPLIDYGLNEIKMNKIDIIMKKLTSHSKSMIYPYLSWLIAYHSFSFKLDLQVIFSDLEVRVLPKYILQNLEISLKCNDLNLFKSCSHFANLCLQKLQREKFESSADSLFKIFKKSILIVEQDFLKNGKIDIEINKIWMQFFKNFVMKCNQDTLLIYYKSLLKFIKDPKSLSQITRKLIFFQTHNEIIKTLQELGIFLYFESFEFILNEFEKILKLSEISQEKLNFLNHLTESINLLILKDQGEFLDSFKTDKIIEILCSSFNLLKLEKSERRKYFTVHLNQAFKALTFHKIQDYQIKDLLQNFFKFFNHSSPEIRYLSLTSLQECIMGLQEKSVMFINDIIPQLGQILDDEEPLVAKQASMVLQTLQKYSQEDLKDYLMDEQANFEA